VDGQRAVALLVVREPLEERLEVAERPHLVVAHGQEMAHRSLDGGRVLLIVDDRLEQRDDEVRGDITVPGGRHGSAGGLESIEVIRRQHGVP